MSADEKKSGNQGIPVEGMVAGGLLGAAAISKALPKIEAFWDHHHTALELGAGLTCGMAVSLVAIKLWNQYVKRSEEDGITAPDETSVFLGHDLDSGKEAHLKQLFRTMHAEVIGTTNAGKSESITLPWAINDIRTGAGVLLMDGKSDSGFLNKLYSYVCKYNREQDFRLFSLSHVGPSFSFNPLRGDSPQEVTERAFSSFKFENEYYRGIQFKIFLSLIRLIFAQKEVPTFSLVQELLTDPEELAVWVEGCRDEGLKKELTRFLKLSEKDREERTSGLEAAISHFTASEVASLFEETDNRIDFAEAMDQGHILYFQLPTMQFPILGSATGRLILQCFQSAVSKRQTTLTG